MLRELLSIFKTSNPLQAMGQNFAQMLTLAYKMTVEAGKIYFGMKASPEARTAIYEHDVRVNKLQRTIRKQVVAHLSIPGNRPDVPYSLLLVSLVKDVERIGDYAKNLSEVIDIQDGSLPEGEILDELKEIRRGVEEAFQVAADVFFHVQSGTGNPADTAESRYRSSVRFAGHPHRPQQLLCGPDDRAGPRHAILQAHWRSRAQRAVERGDAAP